MASRRLALADGVPRMYRMTNAGLSSRGLMLPAMHRLPLAPLRAVAALKQDLAAAARVVHPRPRRRHASSVACELDRRADDAADAVALVVPHQGVSWSYGELRTKAHSLAAGLHVSG